MAFFARILLSLAVSISLTGCGAAALPVRATSAAVKVVPGAGHIAAYPLDKTVDVID